MSEHVRGALLSAMTFFFIVDGAALAARVYVRTRILRSTSGFSYDDVVMCAAYTGYVMMCLMCFVAIYYGFAAPLGEIKPWYDLQKAQHFYFATQVLCTISSGLVKLAIALVLFRVTPHQPVRYVLAGSIIIVIIWTVVMTLFNGLWCAGSMQGHSGYAGSETCAGVGYFRASSNLVFDWFYALIPVALLWKVQMSKKMKASVMILLGLGILASFATIVKVVAIAGLSHSDGASELERHYVVLLWAQIELGLSIFAGSCAALRPILKHLPGLRRVSDSQASNMPSTGHSWPCKADIETPVPSYKRCRQGDGEEIIDVTTAHARDNGRREKAICPKCQWAV